MPSEKLPPSVNIGPGKLPTQVVNTASQSSTLTTFQGVDATAIVIANATGDTVLPRSGSNILCLCFTLDASWTGNTITLPATAEIGDRITIVDVDGNAEAENITIEDASGTIGGAANVVINQNRGSIVAINIADDTWNVETQVLILDSPVSVVTVTDTVALTRLGPNLVVNVDTSHGDWTTGDTITLPASPVLGDRITIQDSAGSGAVDTISILAPGSYTINGLSGTTLNRNYGSLVLVNSGTNLWNVLTVDRKSSVQTISSTTILTRESGNHTVLVQTSGGWSSGNTITLPSAAEVGDVIRIKDVDGNSISNFVTVVPAGGDTIEGDAVSLLSRNYGSLEFTLVNASTWQVEAPTYVQSISASTTLAAGQGPDTLALIDTSSVGWSANDTYTLNSNARVGSVVSVVDVGGSAGVKPISIAGGTSTIDGRSAVSLHHANAVVILQYVATNEWVTLSRTIDLPSTQMITASGPTTISPSRSRHLVEVDTSNGSWVGSGTVNLPASADVGDQVTIIDVGGNAGLEPITIDGNGNTIRGDANYVITQGLGYLVVRMGASEWAVVSEPESGTADTRIQSLSRAQAFTELFPLNGIGTSRTMVSNDLTACYYDFGDTTTLLVGAASIYETETLS